MAKLISPGVDITIVNDTLSASTDVSTIPMIFVATASNKLTQDGSIAEGTLPENAGKLELITSQRELLQRFGVPFFRQVDGTVIQGDEVNEYGLSAAYSALGITNRAYLVRADLDTSQLMPTEQKPVGRPKNGTYWFDYSETAFGVFVANGNEIAGLAWDKAQVLTPSASNVDPVTGIPSANFGVDGQYAVVTSFVDNRIYEKLDGKWEVIGSSDWVAAKPTVALGTGVNIIGTDNSANLILNDNVVEIFNGDSIYTVSDSINNANIAGISATVVSGRLRIECKTGDLRIASSGDARFVYGFQEEYKAVTLQYQTHINVPNGNVVGSIWIKTTTPNGGASYSVKRFNASLDQFQNIEAPFYATDAAADFGYGNAKAVGSLYVQYDVDGDASVVIASQTIKRWNGSQWEILSYEASTTEPHTDAPEGTLWYNAALEADILVNTGNQWRGYRNLYPATDANGPQMTSEMPTAQSNGAPLANYDLWIDTDESLDYPRIYRYINGEWNLVDNADRTTPFGVVFGDIREDSGPLGPWIRGGTAATGKATLKAANVYVKETGEGYVDGTYTATVLGGDTTNATTLEVVVVAGEVYSVKVDNAGSYTKLPEGAISVKVAGIAGGTGNEAVFSINWVVDTVSITSGGAGYTTNPIINIVGGGGIGATAFTAVDNGVVISASVVNGGAGYAAIPNVLINSPFGRPESTNVADMAVSDWNDPVALDLLNPQLFPAGMILFNTRRSTNNVKVWRPQYFEGIKNYTVGNFLSDAYELSHPGARDAAYTYLASKPARWVNFSGNDLSGIGLFGRNAQRICVVRALAAQIVGNQDVRAESVMYSLLTAPGYVEVFGDLITLNVDRKETAFIITDVPSTLKNSATALQAWGSNSANAASNGKKARTSLYDFAAMYYPWGLGTNVDGNKIVIPSSAIALRTYIYNDSVSYPWMPPAGSRRGVVSNAESVGYIDEKSRAYVPVQLNPGQRDVLYTNKINPITYINGRGLLVYGDKTTTPNDTSPLSRVNVARMIVYIRTVLPSLVVPFQFELNTEQVRAAAREVVSSFLTDLLGKQALEDFLVVCDESNNDRDRRARNELWIDVAVVPTKSINFIYIPVRVKNEI